MSSKPKKPNRKASPVGRSNPVEFELTMGNGQIQRWTVNVDKARGAMLRDILNHVTRLSQQFQRFQDEAVKEMTEYASNQWGIKEPMEACMKVIDEFQKGNPEIVEGVGKLYTRSMKARAALTRQHHILEYWLKRWRATVKEIQPRVKETNVVSIEEHTTKKQQEGQEHGNVEDKDTKREGHHN